MYVPRPKVNGATVHLRPLIKPRVSVDYEILDLVLRSLFNQKRSTLRKGLDLLFPDDRELREEILKSSDIDTSLRVSCLSVEDINRICLNCLPHINSKSAESRKIRHS